MSKPAQRIITVTNIDIEVVVFMNPDGSAQAVLTDPNKPKHPTFVPIAKPPDGHQIVMTRYPHGHIEVVYREKDNG